MKKKQKKILGFWFLLLALTAAVVATRMIEVYSNHGGLHQ